VIDTKSAKRRGFATERDLLVGILDLIREHLPPGWSMDVDAQTPVFGPDAFVSVTSPDGQTGYWAVLVKRTFVIRDVLGALDQLQDAADLRQTEARSRGRTQGGPAPLLAARYLAATVREDLDKRGVSYADASGNMRMQLDRPGLYVRDVGATADPWRGPGRPRGTLRGEPAARVVRALADFTPPYTVPELAKLAGASTGGTYRVVEFLEEEGLLERSRRGPITVVRWAEMITRWSRDYGFIDTNDVRRYLSLRGLDAVMANLAALEEFSDQSIRYAVTGSFAAEKYEPWAPAKMAMIYTDQPRRLADTLNLRPVDSAADVLLARPAFDVVYERGDVYGQGQPGQDVNIVAASQLAVDLLTGPGRNPSEGEALLDWMRAHEDVWRKAAPQQLRGQ
jgi:hypothetical protein